MAESISIPLTHIQDLLDEIVPSWVYSRLQEIKSMLIQIQVGENCRLLQDLTIDPPTYLQKISDIRNFSYQIDDQLDTIFFNVESYRRWVKRGISRVIKSLPLAYYKSRILHNNRSLMDLVKRTKFIRSHISDIREGNEDHELQRLSANLHRHHQNLFYDFEGGISIFDTNSMRQRIISIDQAIPYIYIKKISVMIFSRVSFHFAFVYVVKNSKRITIYRDILKQVLSNYKQNDVVGLMFMKEDELWKELVEVLASYKCCIVLIFDHKLIYDQELVETLKLSKGSISMINAYEMDLHPIDERDAWELLESITFLKGYKNIFELKEIGMNLIAECKGVPRQIFRIGGVLQNNLAITYWKMAQISFRYRAHSHCHWKILAFSYDHLSIHLKACFLYFGQFWNGDSISTEMLYQMWMAEGLVSSHLLVGEKTTMDRAEEYLTIFVTRLLIDVQISKFSTSRVFELCRIDNYVKDFCLQPEGMQENFQMVNETLYGFNSSSQDGRRLSMKFYFSAHELDQNSIDTEVMLTLSTTSMQLRSLLMLKVNGIPRIRISFPSEICKKFKLLRVLKIENFEIQGGNFPKDIRNLIHLKFLSLEGSTFEKLPKTLGNFQFMQTLDLRVAEIIPRGIIVPNVVWKLKELRHLYLPSCHHVPKGKDKLFLNGLTKLETLVNFDIDKVELTSLEWESLRHIDARVHGKKPIRDLIDFINKRGDKLKETFLHVSFLGFSYGESDVPLEDVLINCRRLNHFMVNWGRCDLKEFSIPNSLSSNLIELCFIRCQIKEDPMPILGKFPQLRKLVLGKKTFMGTKMVFEEESFPTLTYLKIENLPHLEDMDIFQRSMPNLFCLEIVCCLKLEMIPCGLRFIKTLTELKIKMPKKFNDQIRTDKIPRQYAKYFEKISFTFLEDW